MKISFIYTLSLHTYDQYCVDTSETFKAAGIRIKLIIFWCPVKKKFLYFFNLNYLTLM